MATKIILMFALSLGVSNAFRQPRECRGSIKMYEQYNGRFYKEIADVGYNVPQDFTSAKNSVVVIPSLNKLAKGRFFIKVRGDCCWKVYQR